MPHSSLAIVNANVITLNPDQPRAEAILAECGGIAAVGSNSEISRKADHRTSIIDAKGKTVVPGLVDCHVHMTTLGFSLQEVDLRNADSIDQLKQRVRDYAESHPKKTWITGGNWDQERFTEKRYPTRWDLDETVSDRPVFLTRVCEHIAVANTKALHLADIKKNTPVKGGSIGLDKTTGEPNGILREKALELIYRTMPKRENKELKEACVAACQKAVEAGLTCVHWMVTSRAEIEALQTLCNEGKLPLRIHLGISIELADHLINLGLLSGFGNDILKLGFVKILADGSLGGRTAALNKGYSDKPDTKGMMLYTQKKLNSLVSKVHRAGLQLAIHAIGDRAIANVLKAYEKALKENPRKDHRHRIEHCSVLNPKLIDRMKDAYLVASVQPHFVVSDFWTESRVGKARARRTFPLKTLIKEGLLVASGSDCPVENISPILGIWAAVARKSIPEQALTTEEALKTYTTNAAHASFEEQIHGSIEVGKLADFTVLSDDLLRIPPDKIREVSVEMTIVGGRTVYTRNLS